MCNMCESGNSGCLNKQCANKCCDYSYGYNAEGNSWKSSDARGSGYSNYAEVRRRGMPAALIYTLIIGALLLVATIVAIAFRRVSDRNFVCVRKIVFCAVSFLMFCILHCNTKYIFTS
jgi:cell division protein FtsW (lipid II flippase)